MYRSGRIYRGPAFSFFYISFPAQHSTLLNIYPSIHLNDNKKRRDTFTGARIHLKHLFCTRNRKENWAFVLQGRLLIRMIDFDTCKRHFPGHGGRFSHAVNAGYVIGLNGRMIAFRRWRPVRCVVHLTAAVNPLLVVDVRRTRSAVFDSRWRQSSIDFIRHEQVTVVIHRLPNTQHKEDYELTMIAQSGMQTITTDSKGSDP